MLLITSFAVLRNTAATLDFAVVVGGLYNNLEVAFQLRVLTCSSEIPTFVERNSRNETGQSSLKPELLSQRDYLYLQ